MAPEIPRHRAPRNQGRSDRLEVRRGIKEVVAGVVEDAVEGTVGLDAQHLIDASEREVMTATGLVASGIHEPWLHADALNERRRLPRGRHRLPRRGRTGIDRRDD